MKPDLSRVFALLGRFDVRAVVITDSSLDDALHQAVRSYERFRAAAAPEFARHIENAHRQLRELRGGERSAELSGAC